MSTLYWLNAGLWLISLVLSAVLWRQNRRLRKRPVKLIRARLVNEHLQPDLPRRVRRAMERVK